MCSTGNLKGKQKSEGIIIENFTKLIKDIKEEIN